LDSGAFLWRSGQVGDEMPGIFRNVRHPGTW
jgi:hypothetical protein